MADWQAVTPDGDLWQIAWEDGWEAAAWPQDANAASPVWWWALWRGANEPATEMGSAAAAQAAA